MATDNNNEDKAHQRGVAAPDGTTKARIERAALTLFVQRGIDGVSIKEIAKEAGISDGAMYRHYPSKYNLSETMMLEIHQRLTLLVRFIHSSGGSIDEKINKLVVRYCAAADDDWALFAYHLLHLHHFPNLFVPGSKKLDSPVTACGDILMGAIDQDEIPSGNIELLASMALGVVIQAAHSKIYGRLQGPLSIYAPDFEKAVLAILKER